MFEIILSFINTEAVSVSTSVVYDNIFLRFLSFLLIIGIFSVSAGAYLVIKIILIIPIINARKYKT